MPDKEKKNIVAIIPARGGSKGVPRKNLRPLGGRPLLAYTVQAALESGVFARVIVSTEDGEIAGVAAGLGAEVVTRPLELATDEATTESALLHVLEHLETTEDYRPGIAALLQATSPLRDAAHIREALDTFVDGGYDSLLSVCRSHAFLWTVGESGARTVNYDYRHRPRRQDAAPEYRENGAIYFMSYAVLAGEKNRLGGRIGIYVMSEEDALEIDTPYDFWLCEKMIEFREGTHDG